MSQGQTKQWVEEITQKAGGAVAHLIDSIEKASGGEKQALQQQLQSILQNKHIKKLQGALQEQQVQQQQAGNEGYINRILTGNTDKAAQQEYIEYVVGLVPNGEELLKNLKSDDEAIRQKAQAAVQILLQESFREKVRAAQTDIQTEGKVFKL